MTICAQRRGGSASPTPWRRRCGLVARCGECGCWRGISPKADPSCVLSWRSHLWHALLETGRGLPTLMVLSNAFWETTQQRVPVLSRLPRYSERSLTRSWQRRSAPLGRRHASRKTMWRPAPRYKKAWHWPRNSISSRSPPTHSPVLGQSRTRWATTHWRGRSTRKAWRSHWDWMIESEQLARCGTWAPSHSTRATTRRHERGSARLSCHFRSSTDMVLCTGWRCLRRWPRPRGSPRSPCAWQEGQQLRLDQAVAYALAPREPAASASNSLAEKPSAPNSHELTLRQREVAVLIGRGLTNREIAEQLVVTERAAAAHVEHILDKLGVGSRVEIAVWASERGLLSRTSD